MKILYTIAALVAVAVIAVGVASLGGNGSVSEIFAQPEAQQQEEYFDNTGDVVGGLPESVPPVRSERSSDLLRYENSDYNFSMDYPRDWVVENNPDTGLGYTPIVSFTNPSTPPVPHSDAGIDVIAVRVVDWECQGDVIEKTSTVTVYERDWSNGLDVIENKSVCIDRGEQRIQFYFGLKAGGSDTQALLDEVVESISY